MVQGGCHCGAIRYQAEGAPLRSGICHCSDCRRHSGAPMVAWVVFPQERFARQMGMAIVYASSEHGRRYFCPACGTGLFYTNDELSPGLIDVQTATLDDPDAFPPTEQIQVAERIGWMEHAHALPAYARFPEDV